MTFSCDFFINRLQISGNDHRLSGKLLVISFLPYFFSQIDGRHEKDFRSWCVFLDLIQQSCDSLSNYICGCSKTVLQSLVPSIRVITSAWACVSRSVGRSAVPFLPSRSGSSKTVVLPHSPSSITRYSSLFSFSWRRLVQRTPHGSLSLLSPSYPHVLESPKHNIYFILPYPYLFSMLLLK